MEDDANEIHNSNNNSMKNSKTTTSKSFEYKTKIIGSTPNDNSILDAEVVVSLTYLSNFWRFLDFPLINYEVELDLKWTKNRAISEISRTFKPVYPNANPVVYGLVTATTGAKFEINKAELYFPFVPLPINDNIKF